MGRARAYRVCLLLYNIFFFITNSSTRIRRVCELELETGDWRRQREEYNNNNNMDETRKTAFAYIYISSLSLFYMHFTTSLRRYYIMDVRKKPGCHGVRKNLHKTHRSADRMTYTL